MAPSAHCVKSTYGSRARTTTPANTATARVIARASGQWTAARTTETVLAALLDANIPAAPVWDLDQLTASDHVAARGLISEGHHKRFGPVPLVPQPVKFSGAQGAARPTTPMLGEHTDEVLESVLGLDGPAIAALKENKAV